MNTYRYIRIVPLLLILAMGCSPSEEAARDTRPLRIDGAGVATVETDLGYTVTLSAARAALTQVTFTRAPTAVARGPLDWIIGAAHAHPGHGVGGDIIGELPGGYIVDWIASDGAALGDVTLIGEANLLNFGFAAGAANGEGSVHLTGVASKDGVDHPFNADFDLSEVLITEVPFLPDALDAPAWGLRLSVIDPFEGDTLFDGIEFATADWTVGAEAYNRLGRALRTHDHYLVSGVTQ